MEHPIDNIRAMTRAIVAAHRATLALPAQADQPDDVASAQAHPTAADAGLMTAPARRISPETGTQAEAEAGTDNLPDQVCLAALQAASAMGFHPADALCVARAWRTQVQRSGQFEARQWPVEPADFGLAPRPRNAVFAPCPDPLGLYAVLPDAAWVGRMARAGVPTLQLRFKSAAPTLVQAEVQAAVAAVQGTSARLFINDHWREAINAGAYGVHLGQEDLAAISPDELETLRQAGLRLGLSSHGYAEMLRADACNPSYLALGAVFATTLKAMRTPPQGLGRLQAYARLMRHTPLVAIGGIDAARLPAVLACGTGSVGVVRALVGAAQPEAAAAHLMALMR